jgi:hypothetical protein
VGLGSQVVHLGGKDLRNDIDEVGYISETRCKPSVPRGFILSNH